jgi:hypothetical protein
MTVGKGKRPRDLYQLAKWIVDRSTGETPEPEHALNPAASSSSTIPPHLSEYMAAIGRKGGQIGPQDHDQGTAEENSGDGC